ncbi:hypothetical protein PHISCL_08684 [Aspergillus sclerotialis]|uniref:gamma-glutamylcyclotransferase n=1 Tax=Aspergillus sclerotialis TaxID=2070753 RepID=A0A3A2Z7V3_9EURO|nr:hypothetical protein PHISCL_08684 [Aspergillus sclerotialis]
MSQTPKDPDSTPANITETLMNLLDSIPLPFSKSPSLPKTTTAKRQQDSTASTSLENDPYLSEKVLHHPPSPVQDEERPPEETVLYLAYGSNLSSKTFLGRRGIKPLSQVNVLVPELRLTFDMPGLPYAEPCFAATRFKREVEEIYQDELVESEAGDEGAEEGWEKTPLISSKDYHRDRWRKPLIGVVYEVSLSDYAKIIATEGGGRGYRDIVVDCYPFAESSTPSDPVPDFPTTKPFKAHSLLSPGAKVDSHTHARRDPRGKYPGVRPNPTHAQPSARYLNLLTSGAAEHELPDAYREYLSQIRPYRITTTGQKIGKVLFLLIWGPGFLVLMALSRAFAGEDGRSPRWLNRVADLLMAAMWGSYDCFFVRMFGEGERTIGDSE